MPIIGYFEFINDFRQLQIFSLVKRGDSTALLCNFFRAEAGLTTLKKAAIEGGVEGNL